MASAIFFNGRRINVPGAYSKLDASGLASVTPSSTGIVALVGTSEGGKPLTVEPEHSDHSTSSSALAEYRGGNLRIASQFAFEPAPSDPVITGGAQKLVNVKVNPATQSSATLNDASANPAMVVTSRDWGLFTTQINVAIGPGTVGVSKKATVTFEDAVEVFDNIGGNPVLTMLFLPGSTPPGYAATLSATTLGMTAQAAFDVPGLGNERLADIAAPGTVTYESSDVGDTTQTVTAYGIDGSNEYASETIVLNGTTPVLGAVSFKSLLGCFKETTTGTVLVKDPVAVATIFSIAPGDNARGIMEIGWEQPINVAASSLSISVAAASQYLIVEGKDAADVNVRQVFDVSTIGAKPFAGTFKTITRIYAADVPAATTISFVVQMFNFQYSSYSTVQKIIDAANGVPGFTGIALLDTPPESFLMTDVDVPTGLLSFSPNIEMTANLYYVVKTLNDNSVLVSAVKATGATQQPANTSSPVYLTGGTEGLVTIAEWTQAFKLLAKRRVNIIVPLTNDPAVHSLLRSHLIDRAGRLKSEANGYVGIGTNAGAGETRSNITQQIRALNTRHISALSQECKRTNPDTGISEWFPPWMFAAISAGMQAGGSVGEPLTFKYPGVTDIRNDPSWTVEDDASDMIDLGLMFAESKDAIGIRFVRSITTYLVDDNLAFGEMSANASANTAVYELRRRVEAKVGRKGLAGSAAGIKGIAAATLSELIDDEIIVAFRSLTVEQIGDVFPISVEIAPVLPINFVPITVHLVAVRITA